MEKVNVYSPVDDKNIKASINDSPVWKKAYNEEEYMENTRRFFWFKYTFKFENTTPIQVTNVKKIGG